MTRVLFVDDEPLLLRSLERTLRVQKLAWETRFVESAAAALDLLAREPVDVVITDLRMPDVDGVELLTEIQREYPRITRLVLSGQVGTEECLRVMRVAHQCLAKPCNFASLRHVVQRIAWGRSLVADADLAEAMTALSSLPTPPQLHAEVCAALKRGAGLAELARFIGRDLASSAKLIQIVNSAFFAREGKIPTVPRALTILGADVIRDLLPSVEVFRAFTGGSEAVARLEADQRHAALVAQVARAVAPPQLANDAFIAGMLHEIGEVVLVALGKHGDHAKVGAFLLAMWGIDDRIVDAVAYHREPGSVTAETAALVDALHVADIAARELDATTTDTISSDWLVRNDTSVLVRARAAAAELWTEGARCAS
jgi:HD-like signal output (HDOD) protein